MPSRQQITFEPAFALMFAEHFHHTSIGCEKLVIGHGRGVPLALGHIKESLQAVREGFVRTKDTEISLFTLGFRYIAQERSKHMSVPNARRPG